MRALPAIAIAACAPALSPAKAPIDYLWTPPATSIIKAAGMTPD